MRLAVQELQAQYEELEQWAKSAATLDGQHTAEIKRLRAAAADLTQQVADARKAAAAAQSARDDASAALEAARSEVEALTASAAEEAAAVQVIAGEVQTARNDAAAAGSEVCIGFLDKV